MLFSALPLLYLAATVTVAVAGDNQRPNILVKDVVIIGGGASGAYAAIRLRDDYNRSIVLVEKQDHLVSISSSIMQFIPHEKSGPT
jgi:heterodisulfide reductase subunit A-like polyferredoxin